MRKLNEILSQVQNDRTAIGHFNVADLVLLKAVFGAARELNVPVFVGASEGERDFMGTRQLAAVVNSLRDEFDFPIFLNADHTHSLAKALEAARLPLEENAKQTKDAVEALKSINPGILVEGDIGDVGSGSEIHDDAPRTASEACCFSAAGRQFTLKLFTNPILDRAISTGNVTTSAGPRMAGHAGLAVTYACSPELRRASPTIRPCASVWRLNSLHHRPRRRGRLVR
jgi:hypothetical protein